MSFFSNKIKEPKETQIIAQNLSLEEVLNESLVAELKKKFGDDVVVIPAMLRFQLLPKQKSSIEIQPEDEKLKKGGIQITLGPADFVTLEHPSPSHFEKKVVVITSNKNTLLRKFIE